MCAENVALRLLNRTKYAQNRTKYYTVRNTVLSQTERPLFVADSYQAAAKNRKMVSIKKAFLNRRASKRGPFQKLSLPHDYFKVFGDPYYYTHEELVAVCESASSQAISDTYFWKQICEKMREVRDVIDIKDLLVCSLSVARANHYDRDLFRMLSREFVQDMDKLSLEEVAQVLECYYRQNVLSPDLIEAVSSKVASTLPEQVELRVKETSDSTTPGFFEKITGSAPKATGTDFSLRFLGKICKYCSHFNSKDPQLFSAIAAALVALGKSMDPPTKLEILAHLDPALVNESPDLLLHPLDRIPEWDIARENSLELGVFLSSQLFRDPANSKLLNDFAGLCSTCTLIASCALNLVRNHNRFGPSLTKCLEGLLSHCAKCSSELAPLLSKVSALDGSSAPRSPFVASLQNLGLDSILSCVRALNAFWRLKLGCVHSPEPRNPCRLLKFTLEDDNVHSEFLKGFPSLRLDQAELLLVKGASDAICQFNCRAQSVANLTVTFECFSALLGNSRPLRLGSSLTHSLAQSTHALSLEITRQLVDLDRGSLYRVTLALGVSGLALPHLQHSLHSFPKVTRRRHERHHISLDSSI